MIPDIPIMPGLDQYLLFGLNFCIPYIQGSLLSIGFFIAAVTFMVRTYGSAKDKQSWAKTRALIDRLLKAKSPLGIVTTATEELNKEDKKNGDKTST